MATKKKAEKDTFMVYRKDLEREIKSFDQSVTKPIAHGMLKDGRNYQIQVTITTDEDDFIEDE